MAKTEIEQRITMPPLLDRPKHEGQLPLDATTYDLAEIGELGARIPLRTGIGGIALHDALLYGVGDLQDITAHQMAVRELVANTQLRGAVGKALTHFNIGEPGVAAFRFGASSDPDFYTGMNLGMAGIRTIANVAPAGAVDHHVRSPLLRTTFGDIHKLDGSPLADRLRGAYYTPVGLRGKDELPWFMWPRFQVKPGYSRRIVTLAVATGILQLGGVISPEISPTVDAAMLTIVLGAAAGMRHVNRRSTLTRKDVLLNQPTVYLPLRRQIDNAPEWQIGLGAVAKLDMLHGFAKMYGRLEEYGRAAAFPQMQSAKEFHFDAQGLMNPVLALQAGRRVVANSVRLETGRPTFVTGGPGQSMLAKAVIMSQVLAQAGAPIAAESARITPADRIYYHTTLSPPIFSESTRFGGEFARIRGMLEMITPHSLAILDDSLGGTTRGEQVALLTDVAQAFCKLGGGVLVATHVHEVAERFRKHGLGRFAQFAHDHYGKPTYQLEPGIAHTTNARDAGEERGITGSAVRNFVRIKTGRNSAWF